MKTYNAGVTVMTLLMGHQLGLNPGPGAPLALKLKDWGVRFLHTPLLLSSLLLQMASDIAELGPHTRGGGKGGALHACGRALWALHIQQIFGVGIRAKIRPRDPNPCDSSSLQGGCRKSAEVAPDYLVWNNRRGEALLLLFGLGRGIFNTQHATAPGSATLIGANIMK